MKKLLLLLVLACTVSLVSAQTTTVYIVRHGEKNLSNPNERDPELSAEGQQRALDLLKTLENEKIHAAFSTPYKRTRNTIGPLVEKNQISIVNYDPAKPKDLVEKIHREFAGKTVIIAGHSNTIQEMAEAFGVVKPLKPLTEDDYDNLLKVVIDQTGPKVSASKYGAKHNSGG